MKKCSQVVDCRKSKQNSQPAPLTCNAESHCDKVALSEAELGQVNAAGDTTIPTMYPNVLLGRHDNPADTKENNP